MTHKYFILWYRLDQVDSYLIWYSNNLDGVVVDSTGPVPTFLEIYRLCAYAGNLGLHLEEEEPILHDLDAVKYWLENPRKTAIKCDCFLVAWNLFGDVALSVQDTTFDQDRQKTSKIYDKLFWGNNLPAVTPLGKHYEPIWNNDEVERLREVLGDGLRMFRRYLVYERSVGG